MTAPLPLLTSDLGKWKSKRPIADPTMELVRPAVLSSMPMYYAHAEWPQKIPFGDMVA